MLLGYLHIIKVRCQSLGTWGSDVDIAAHQAAKIGLKMSEHSPEEVLWGEEGGRVGKGEGMEEGR